jgi:hypothetical protein
LRGGRGRRIRRSYMVSVAPVRRGRGGEDRTAFRGSRGHAWRMEVIN